MGIDSDFRLVARKVGALAGEREKGGGTLLVLGRQWGDKGEAQCEDEERVGRD